jgi:hypothetical protein
LPPPCSDRHPAAYVQGRACHSASRSAAGNRLAGTMAMRDEDRVVVRLSVADRRDLDLLRGPVGRGSFLRTLLRRATERAQEGDRDDALASLAENDVQVGRVLREIEMKDRLDRLRLLAGD